MARGFLYLWPSGLAQPVRSGLGIVQIRVIRPTGTYSTPTREASSPAAKDRGVKISIGRGRYQDNILVERLWRTVKYEEVYLKAYANGLEARRGLREYFRFYNHRRPHQALGYRTPAEVFHGEPVEEELKERRCPDQPVVSYEERSNRTSHLSSYRHEGPVWRLAFLVAGALSDDMVAGVGQLVQGAFARTGSSKRPSHSSTDRLLVMTKLDTPWRLRISS